MRKLGLPGRPFLLLFFLVNGAVALDACGSRTGLPADELGLAPEDAGNDVTLPHDAGRDGARDVVSEDALPPIDGTPIVDVRRDDCPDADATLVYLVSDANDLLSFYPPTLEFRTIGKIACPAAGATPFSMAVDRKGKAYVVFTDGRLYQVSTATAACIATPFAPNQQGFFDFGMGFVSNTGGPEETLFVAQSPGTQGGLSSGLGAIDVTNFKLNFVGSFSQPIERLELTGTGDARLFGFAPSNSGSRVVQIDKTNGDVVAADPVAAGGSQDAFAFAYWGGDFWIFTGQGATTVYRYRPADRSTTSMTTAPALIVGAGVSTCAPQ